MTPAIRVDSLAKRYRLGSGRGDDYRTLRESLVDAATAPLRRLRALASPRVSGPDAARDHWALKDVSFEVERGGVVGVIGRNGAGKSTLLKIFSRITEPTSGRAELRGRVGSLLEVGTGFHPELTGRENVYLSGAILGMPRREIARRFDEIVAFSEVGPFLETPVKRYSSGMYVRLAFAVAAHLEPDILLVDEVLAVGDATYQRRCVDCITRLASSGMTVLFVSHNMDLIPRLCQTAVLLDGGRVRARGPASQVVSDYLSELTGATEDDLTGKTRTGDGRARFTRLQLIGPDGSPKAVHVSGDDLILRIEVDATRALSDVALAASLQTLAGARIISSWTREVGYEVALDEGPNTFICHFRHVRLRPGHRVSIQLWMECRGVVDSVQHARVVDVVDSPDTRSYSTDAGQGIVICDYEWSKL